MKDTDLRSVLDAAANQILAVVAPLTARVVRAYVTLDLTADTAATDGIRIWVPPRFEGVDVVQDTPVAIGLLVHELGHFLQPLAGLTKVEEQTGAPHWLANILADVQLEAMMAGLFPPLADTLRAVRTAVKQTRMADYLSDLQNGRDFAAIACAVALAGRFGDPYRAFDIDRRGTSQTLLPALKKIVNRAVADYARRYAWQLAGAARISPIALPDYLADTIRSFPELAMARETFPVPGAQVQVRGAAANAAQGEAASNVGDHGPAEVVPVNPVRHHRTQPLPAAIHAACGLRMHFDVTRGASEIAAPGRLDRRAMAMGELAPFRLTLPGKEMPRPRVVICLDKSGSMKGNKIELAQSAAQAVALAVRAAEGDVVGVLFDHGAQIAHSGDDALLFCERRNLNYGGTDFGFLAETWRRWPEHIVLLITDGDGAIPLALPGDRARTAVLLIPPEHDPALMCQIAGHVVTLRDLRGLADVLTLLVPRLQVA